MAEEKYKIERAHEGWQPPPYAVFPRRMRELAARLRKHNGDVAAQEYAADVLMSLADVLDRNGEVLMVQSSATEKFFRGWRVARTVADGRAE